jgi:DNA-binding MarR family transcriptional regulator
MRAGDALEAFAELSHNDLGLLLTGASTAVTTELFARLTARGHAVRPALMPVIGGLDPEGTTISVLATRAHISRQAMSVLVRDVESAGYVATSTDPGDRRAIRVELTERGAELCRDAADVSHEITAEWRATLGAKPHDALLEQLRTLAGR